MVPDGVWDLLIMSSASVEPLVIQSWAEMPLDQNSSCAASNYPRGRLALALGDRLPELPLSEGGPGVVHRTAGRRFVM